MQSGNFTKAIQWVSIACWFDPNQISNDILESIELQANDEDVKGEREVSIMALKSEPKRILRHPSKNLIVDEKINVKTTLLEYGR